MFPLRPFDKEIRKYLLFRTMSQYEELIKSLKALSSFKKYSVKSWVELELNKEL